jgi:hypothetical protein
MTSFDEGRNYEGNYDYKGLPKTPEARDGLKESLRLCK